MLEKQFFLERNCILVRDRPLCSQPAIPKRVVGHRAVNVWRNTHLWVSLFERRPRCRAVAKLKWWPVSAQNATFTKNFFSNISLHWVCHDVLMTRMLRWFPVLREHALALRIYIFVLLEVRFVRLEACQCCSYNILFSLKTTANQRHFSLRQTWRLIKGGFLDKWCPQRGRG